MTTLKYCYGNACQDAFKIPVSVHHHHNLFGNLYSLSEVLSKSNRSENGISGFTNLQYY